MVTSCDSQTFLLQWKQKIRVSLVKKTVMRKVRRNDEHDVCTCLKTHPLTHTNPPRTGTSSNNSSGQHQEEWNGECASRFLLILFVMMTLMTQWLTPPFATQTFHRNKISWNFPSTKRTQTSTGPYQVGRSHDDGHHGLEPNDGPSRNAATQRRPLKTESVNQQISNPSGGWGGGGYTKGL